MNNVGKNNFKELDTDKQERFENILSVVENITNLPRQEIVNKMKETITYKQIVDGNWCYIYESYPANLLDMIEEWKEKDIPVLSEITERKIAKVIRDNKN